MYFKKNKQEKNRKSKKQNLISQKNFEYIVSDFVFVLKTKYPLFQLLFKFLTIILNEYKFVKLKYFPKYEQANKIEDFIKNFDNQFFIRYLKKYMHIFLAEF